MSKMDESKIYVAFLAMIENLDNYKFFKIFSWLSLH